MKKTFLTILIMLGILHVANAQNFDDFFIDKTLRIDYIFTGNTEKQNIYLDELVELPSWAGRRQRLAELPLHGNGQVIVKAPDTGKVIYKTSFSSLFQEWLTTDEAKHTAKAFENTFLVPYPKNTVEIEVILFDSYHLPVTQLKHTVNPDDILIHTKGITNITPHTYLHKSGDEKDCIDVAIVAEGYTKEEMEIFYADAAIAVESLFDHEPFGSLKTRFNFVAVASPSVDSGVSVPRANEWKQTAFGSHFDTFYSDRYLTTSRVKAIHDALAGIPYEHIIILANTQEYGGGGIYNAFTLTTAHHPSFRPIVVHEFGHSFGGLADEYFYENDIFSETYPFSVEPWEQNITTFVNFGTKWEDMLKKSTPIPTPVDKAGNFLVGVYEGAGYSAKGIFRPAYNCRMRTNEYKEFCPVCRRSLQRIIDFYTK